MESMTTWIGVLNGWVWGPPMLVLILGTGLFLLLGLRLMPWLRLGYGFRMLWSGRRGRGEGDITPFNALMTSLSATVGTGNIAGVGTAIAIGGPGALFWMWCTALVGMATKYAEGVLAVKYREVDAKGNHVGGPMYYIKNGLGRRWLWLGAAFAVFGAMAGFGIGNMVQANSVADALNSKFALPKAWVGGVMALLVGLVLIGGIRWIAQVAGKLVPFMAIAYVLGGLVVLGLNAEALPGAVVQIVEYAFSPTAAVGGFAGATVMMGIQMGVARGVFSNEAGLGSAPIAHAAAKNDNPVQQGTIAMLGTFIDTLIICTITGLVIMVTGAWTSGETGASLSTAAFGAGLPGVGGYVVALGLALFAFTTILGWSVYGERCVEYLFGVRAILPFRLVWVAAIPVGAMVKLEFVWLVADTLNAMMALPNLLALVLLSPVVFRLTREHFARA
ncbi:sodium:alanine symporter family protein [Marichromatium gracile]|uniref:AGCS family alanine or glycine:cation symporter n=1 Tax=Marichromatium gracile TaxID=1048 RepID=A0A4R4ADM4_MARGR|nr:MULTISPECIES: sodium:alanine symporter family protein [Marichromatium]MBO8087068.1 sodium:alanine symporter family protein [Marichromatium sp.]MBK1709749.1 sodium:alanine symporter family protein [Marichromatium gracile]MCF1182638.1 sodium:alanine symporter family protein [Marichromatium gracile]RNE91458.1 sodium:alanine symporter family protein [Marichromatium sp. AB31]RNE92830.1 sodium:alanine symporter family protein [Marichromatium sp. AB32]